MTKRNRTNQPQNQAPQGKTEIALTESELVEIVRSYAVSRGLAKAPDGFNTNMYWHIGSNGRLLSMLVRVEPVPPQPG
jgi:hypothetical protein